MKADTIQKLVAEIKEIAQKGYLPDGDGVNMPTVIWAEEWCEKFKTEEQTNKPKKGQR